jgi:putative ABC transport system permease protein
MSLRKPPSTTGFEPFHGALDDLLRDVRYALRTLGNNPSFAVIVIATLAIGIGANAAIFSVMNTVLLRPLKTPDADRLVRFSINFGGTTPSSVAGGREFDAWRRTPAFEDVSAYRLEFVNMTGGSQAEQIPIGRVSERFFSLFHAPVLQGRVFTDGEDRPNGDAVAILSHGLWTRRFAADPAAVGQTIMLGNIPYRIVGVLGPSFETEQFEPAPDVWLPFQIDPERIDGGNIFFVGGRLKPGINLSNANAQLAGALAAYLERARSTSRNTWRVQPLQDAMVSGIRPALILLMSAVGLVLLIACANVANLLLVRSDARKREIAVRTAIGADRARIVRQLLTETLMLWTGGALAGLTLGWFGARGLLRLYPGSNPFTLFDAFTLPRIGRSGSAVVLDWRVLAFTLSVTALTGIVFGLLPAMRAARTDPYAILKETAVTATAGRRRRRARSALVISEIALALMLLIGASLLIRTSLKLNAVPPGFDSHNVLTMRMSVAGTRFERRDGMEALTREGSERIRSIPGVLSAGTACCMPLETVWQLPFIIQGRELSGRFHAFGGWTFVSPGYFETFNIPIIRGRSFTDRDNASSPGVVVINEAMARQFWPGSDPLNDRLIIGRTMRPEYESDPVRQIIGIVGDVRAQGLTRAVRPEMYVPVAQVPDGVTALNVRLLPIVWIVRTQGAPYSVASQVESELRQTSGLPVARMRLMDEVVSESTARTALNTWLMTVFAASALLLAMVGVYGLLSYAVEQRAHEIGIRMALGAAAGKIRSLVLLQGMAMTVIGLGIGGIAAYFLSRLLAGFLFGVAPHDPLVFAVAPLFLAVTAFLAVWIPARRASHISPVTLLRHN